VEEGEHWKGTQEEEEALLLQMNQESQAEAVALPENQEAEVVFGRRNLEEGEALVDGTDIACHKGP
jgi:hypothetical protein